MNQQIANSPALKALFIDTIKKEMRSKTLLSLFIFTTIAMYIMYRVIGSFGEMVNGPVPALGGIGFSVMFLSINSLSIIIATLLGTGAIRSDFREKIFYTLLTLPISRTQYFFTRIVGVWAMSAGYYLYSFILGIVFLGLLQKSFTMHWTFIATFFISTIVLFIVLVIAGIFALFFSQIWSIISTFVFVGLMSYAWNSLSALVEVKATLASSPISTIISGIFYFLFPHLSLYSEISSLFLMGKENAYAEILKYNWAFEIPHLIVSFFLLIFIARSIITRKDF